MPLQESVYRVETPFQYDDGDFVSLRLEQREDFWRVSDGGEVFMRLSYRLDDRALQAESRSRMIQSALAIGEVKETRGELTRDATGAELGEAVLAVAQAALRIASVAILTQERVRTTFAEDLSEVLDRLVPSDRRIPGWHDRRRDPHGLYVVDWRIDLGPTPIFLFGLTSTLKVKDATIAVHEFLRWSLEFRSVGVVGSEEGISKKSLRQFGEISEHTFYRFPGNIDRLTRYLAEHANPN